MNREDRYNSSRLASGEIQPSDVSLLTRHFQAAAGLHEDGMLGPATLTALRAQTRPRNRAEVYDRFGDPGLTELDANWAGANLVTCHARGDRPALPGVPSERWVTCHKGVEPMMRRALEHAERACPEYRISRLGCHNFRHQRHDPTRPLSYHSWGIAFDVDPDRNQAVSFKNGAPKPWSREWREVWPDGLPMEWVHAVELEGWVWGGRWTRFCDPMHFQFVG